MTVNDKDYQRSVLIRVLQSEPKHPETADELNRLAEQLEADGKYVEAELLYRRALVITELAFGPDHLETANSLSRLAVLFRATDNSAAAEPLYRRACIIWSAVLTRRAAGNRQYH